MIIFIAQDEARSNGGRVLVHCEAGMSRSAAVIIAYLLFAKIEGVTMIFSCIQK